MSRLEGKVAIITGAGQGIGKAYAERFVAEGARVAVADINDAGAKAVADELGDAAIPVHVDVTDEESTKAMAEATVAAWDRIDVLVNNAGLYYDLDQKDFSLDYLKRVLDVNMIGPWLCARAAVPAMKRGGGGTIINQSSGAAWLYLMAGYLMREDSDVLPSFHYPISKSGVNALTHFMAAALGKFNITVNAIAPGTTMTDATRKHVPEKLMGMLTMTTALGRTLEPEEIAHVAVFLASDEARAITGQVIPVDAGQTMLG